MNDSSSERREYFRINDQAIVTLKKIQPDQSLKSLKSEHSSFLLSSAISTLDMEHQAVISKIKRSNPDIALYLDVINKKISLVANHIMENSLDVSGQSQTEIDLSAAGIAIESTGGFAENDTVEIKLILLPEKTGILSIGRIMRVKQKNNTNILCIDFEQISEPDRELIIKHTMVKQLEQARAKNHDYD